MKIRAGWKFQGRKPTQIPPVIADSSPAALAFPAKIPGCRTMYTKNAPEAIAIMPAARPSRPSTRLTAFRIATTQITVSGTARSDPTTAIWPGSQR